ncbi:MAG: hypothetical protein JWR44_3858 [Hymenobacter sp.]|nr:hypothetical protein [Hymenobacter sp.]
MNFSRSFSTFRLLSFMLVGTAGLVSSSCSNDLPALPVDNTDYQVKDDEIIRKYLTDNNITTAQKQPSGLYYIPVTANAAGVQAVAGRTVSVLYTGRFMDGRIFDASKNQYTPIDFVLGRGQVIKGWDEGIALMRKGEKAVLIIPSGLAYGAAGAGTIPPNTVLRFEVELVNVQ